MIGWTRTAVVARSVGRDLLRRRGALVLLAALPGAFYLSVSGEEIPPGEEPWNLTVGTIGIAWAVAGGAFFLALASQRIDTRLLLAGYRKSELVAGRVAFLLVFAALVVMAYTILLGAVADADWWPLFLALATTGAVAVFLGLALAAFLPRELEGTIALVLVVGVQSSVPTTSPIAPYLPFYGPMQLVRVAWFGTGPTLTWLLLAAAAAALLFTVAYLAWARTTYFQAPSTIDAARP